MRAYCRSGARKNKETIQKQFDELSENLISRKIQSRGALPPAPLLYIKTKDKGVMLSPLRSDSIERRDREKIYYTCDKKKWPSNGGPF